MTKLQDETFALNYNINIKHIPLMNKIKEILAICNAVPEEQITADLSTDEFGKLTKKYFNPFDLVNFCLTLEDKLENQESRFSFGIDEGSNPAYFVLPFPATGSLLFGTDFSCPFINVGDWIHWSIYVYIRYAKIHISFEDKESETMSGEEFLNRLIVDKYIIN